jgi:hypothetical protein
MILNLDIFVFDILYFNILMFNNLMLDILMFNILMFIIYNFYNLLFDIFMFETMDLDKKPRTQIEWGKLVVTRWRQRKTVVFGIEMNPF